LIYKIVVLAYFDYPLTVEQNEFDHLKEILLKDEEKENGLLFFHNRREIFVVNKIMFQGILLFLGQSKEAISKMVVNQD
jgi:hypothetical protein